MKLPFVVSIPHCSGRIPESIQPTLALSPEAVEESVDWGTREVFGALDAASVLCACWSRLVVDLNRNPGRRDAKGVIATIDYSGRQVYRQGKAPDTTRIEDRLTRYYWPYHLGLREALKKDTRIKGLIDGHSLYGIGPSEAPDPGMRRKDIVLSNNGDRNGEPTRVLGPTTCSVHVLDTMRQVFMDAGFSVSLNAPYTAGFITAHYGRALAGQGKFAVQIEINQDLFTEPGTINIVPERLAAVVDRIQNAFEDLACRI